MCGIWAVFGSDDNVSVQCNAAHKIGHRGPDAFRIENINHLQNSCLGFHRLSIVDDIRGMQPLRLYTHPYIWLVYNGEIYNHKRLGKEFNLVTSTDVDGEPMIHLYQMLGAEAMVKQLDGVFAFCILDVVNRKVILGLFGLSHSLSDDDVNIEQFPPGHIEIYDLDKQGRAFLKERTCFNLPGQFPLYKTNITSYSQDVKTNVAKLLEAAVDKRLMADVRIGCLLSGGLDSSLVAALFKKVAHEKGITYPLQTFAVGLEGSPDLKAAKKVAEHLGTEHHEVIMTPEEGLEAIDSVIYHLESYDITTVRASVGMFLLSKYIREKTNTKVILSGEGSDEVAQGYIYFHHAPSSQDGDKESRRLLKDLYMYDVLRADRATAAWSLEVRVPFLDHQFSSYYLSLNANLRQPKDNIEKYLLRSAFDETDLLPKEILWRPKEAFSDGISSVSRSWYQIIQDYCHEQINDKDLKEAARRFPHNTPKTKEALYYRQIFEKHYPGKAKWIPYFWMPAWSKSDDPSARTLKHYKQ